jgi:CRP-like cAMP-binding protein
MHEVFRQYIAGRITLTAEEWQMIDAVCIEKKLRKNQYLLQEGDVWKWNAFICEGCLRRYTIDTSGIEHIAQFTPENWWTGDRQSLVNGTPSKYNIDAIEDAVVTLLSKYEFDGLCSKIPAFNEMINQILHRSLIATQERVNVAISLGATEKYLNFIESYPQLANRIPRHMLASYLGITPESLSRIKKQLAGK